MNSPCDDRQGVAPLTQTWSLRAKGDAAPTFSALDVQQQTVIYSMHYNMGGIWKQPPLDARRILFDGMAAGLWADVVAYWEQKMSQLREIPRRIKELKLLRSSPAVAASQSGFDASPDKPRPPHQDDVLRRMIVTGYSLGHMPKSGVESPWDYRRVSSTSFA